MQHRLRHSVPSSRLIKSSCALTQSRSVALNQQETKAKMYVRELCTVSKHYSEQGRSQSEHTHSYLLIQKPIVLYMRKILITKCSMNCVPDLIETHWFILTGRKGILTDHRSSRASFDVGQVRRGSNGSHQTPGTWRPSRSHQSSKSWRACWSWIS